MLYEDGSSDLHKWFEFFLKFLWNYVKYDKIVSPEKNKSLEVM